ncbi:NAD(P)/FAD-dependent oxidoreductase [Acetobacterium sp.]|uniref:phytoene desaturase family protein n=1 Tax=Acetobacterium sp. TaxID=1872094 RepID=UPI0027241B54|nr:NAD(P)/FAD-dependent oxidoreductase [Acetobacterium sp.]MDO9494015.1 NAD(P)/FAD-dependent oxidoreductase [Acetobacterium sp.]
MKDLKTADKRETREAGNTYDVIVVGAGMAGLTSAAYLSKAGYTTLLCEKSEKPGGLVGSFCRQGFSFDAGIRAFENSGIVLPMLAQLGIALEFVNNPVVIGIEDTQMTLEGVESLAAYATMLSAKFPDNQAEIAAIIDEIRKVTGYMDVLYGIENPLFMDLTMDKEYLFKTLLPWLLKYQVNIRKAQKLNEPIESYLLRFTKNQAIIDVISQHFFEKMPTFFALSYFGLYSDYSYLIGGTGRLVTAMRDFIAAHQGELVLGTEISQIDIRTRQVMTRDGRRFGYQELIWCGDMKALYKAVDDAKSGELGSRVWEQQQKIHENCGGDSILTVYLGVNLEPPYFARRCGPHCFYTPSKAGLSAIQSEHWPAVLADPTRSAADQQTALKAWVREYLELTTYEISCPALRDPALAPAGKTGVIVSTLMDYRLVKAIAEAGWYRDFKDLCEEQILAVLENSVFPGLTEQVEQCFSSTPLTIERLTGNSGGAITGWAFPDDAKAGKLPAVSVFRKIAKTIETPLPHIYQAGQWTFSPSGLPVSILTGKLAADGVIKQLKKQRRSGRSSDESGARR